MAYSDKPLKKQGVLTYPQHWSAYDNDWAITGENNPLPTKDDGVHARLDTQDQTLNSILTKLDAISGSVSVDNFPSTQDVNVNNFPTDQDVTDADTHAKLDSVISQLNATLDTRNDMERYGATVNERPSADSVPVGTTYMAVDTSEVWQSNGSSWVVLD